MTVPEQATKRWNGDMTTAAVDDVSSDERADGSARTIGAGRAFAWLLVITGAAGLLASWVITIDKFKL
ncbi:hypothetical protein ABTX78_34475, partial [Streptomyces sp. NPDC096193]